MKECISIYLGGEIITPDLCDYDSYKMLGLKCPFCHSPIFLRQESSYKKGGKLINRGACFAHFKIDAEQGELCEARAITKAGKKEIEAIRNKQRNQRLNLFNRHFFGIIYIHQKKEIMKCIALTKKKLGKIGMISLRDKAEKQVKNQNSILKINFLTIDALGKNIDWLTSFGTKERNTELLSINRWKHSQICTEISTFLYKTKNQKLIEDLTLYWIAGCLAAKAEEEAYTYLFADDPYRDKKMAEELCVQIAKVNWTRNISIALSENKGFQHD